MVDYSFQPFGVVESGSLFLVLEGRYHFQAGIEQRNHASPFYESAHVQLGRREVLRQRLWEFGINRNNGLVRPEVYDSAVVFRVHAETRHDFFRRGFYFGYFGLLFTLLVCLAIPDAFAFGIDRENIR